MWPRVRTRAVRDGDEWVINGTKMWITNGTQADWLCLLCRTSDEGGYRGMSQVVVPTDVPGFSVSRKLDKLGMRASDTAELVFEDLRVPVSNTIGEIGRGFQQQMAQFQNERMIAAYQMVGATELPSSGPCSTCGSATPSVRRSPPTSRSSTSWPTSPPSST